MPNIYKIGLVDTENKTSHDRALELSQNTNCPTPFKVIFDIKVTKPQIYEKRIHNILNKYRVSKNREFFNCDITLIKKCFNKSKLVKHLYEHNDFAENYFNEYISLYDNKFIYNIKKYIYRYNNIYDCCYDIFYIITCIMRILLSILLSLLYFIYLFMSKFII
jgi:hypothetical protein